LLILYKVFCWIRSDNSLVLFGLAQCSNETCIKKKTRIDFTCFIFQSNNFISFHKQKGKRRTNKLCFSKGIIDCKYNIGGPNYICTPSGVLCFFEYILSCSLWSSISLICCLLVIICSKQCFFFFQWPQNNMRSLTNKLSLQTYANKSERNKLQSQCICINAIINF